MGNGLLILVVGPSGAGKDTLLDAAAKARATDERFVFGRRMVTRAPQADAEDHDHVSWDEFNALVANEDYTLFWEAHGLGYILPRSIHDAVEGGKIAICNGSRNNLTEAVRRYPDLAVIIVDANQDIRAERLAGRGRESATDISKRLARETKALPRAAKIITVDNSGVLEAGIADFFQALEDMALYAGHTKVTA